MILTPSSGPSALASQPLPCARLRSGRKGAVSLDKSILYSWGTLTTPHLLSSNGLSRNKVRTTVSHRFHRTSESLQEAATLAGDLNKVHPLVVKLAVSFLPPPSTKKSLKNSSKKSLPSAFRRHCNIALKYSSEWSAHLFSFQDQLSRGSCKERAPLHVHHHCSWKGALTSTMSLLWLRKFTALWPTKCTKVCQSQCHCINWARSLP